MKKSSSWTCLWGFLLRYMDIFVMLLFIGHSPLLMFFKVLKTWLAPWLCCKHMIMPPSFSEYICFFVSSLKPWQFGLRARQLILFIFWYLSFLKVLLTSRVKPSCLPKLMCMGSFQGNYSTAIAGASKNGGSNTIATIVQKSVVYSRYVAILLNVNPS